MKFTGRDGKLRILDGTKSIIAPGSVDIQKFDGVATWTDIKSDVIADDVNFESAFLGDTNDTIYIGTTYPFSMIRYLKGNGLNYGVGTGALIIKYYNGTDFSNSITDITDNTESGGNCFAQDGYIGFKQPAAWSTGANSFNANLDSDKYYIGIQVTSSATTDPDADILAPIESQYFEVAFSAMDFSGQIGRPKTEEQLVLNRGTVDQYSHYIESADDVIYEPVAVTFSCLIDDVVNKDSVISAIQCGNPSSTYWSSSGVTTKSTTKNDGVNYNPAFAESDKKAVNIQIVWNNSNNNSEGLSYYECYSPLNETTISEAEDGITLSVNAGCYGVIERIYQFGNKY